MEFTRTQKELFTYPFYTRRGFLFNNSHYSNSLLNKDSIYTRFWVINNSKDSFEFPVFFRNAIEYFNNSFSDFSDDYDKLILPLYPSSSKLHLKTSEGIVRNIFKYSLSSELCNISTPKGETYYGMRGVIFNDNFNPLLLITLTLDKESKKYEKVTIYIHPEVFLNTDSMICKYIIKKMIPFYLSYNRYDLLLRSLGHNADRSIVAQIVIEDASKKFIQFSNKPSIQDYNDEVFNQILIENMNDIISQI